MSVRASSQVALSASAEDLWPFLVETDRMNRVIGLAPVEYRPIAPGGGSAARFLADTRLGGFAVTYEEFPFEWERPKRFGVYRKFVRGPMSWLRMRWTLEPRGAGTDLTVTFEADTVTPVLRGLAWIGGRRAVAGMVELARAIERHLVERAPSPFVKPVAPSKEDALAAALARLRERGVRGELADKIAAHIEGSPDADAIRIRPFELADTWNEPRREVLTAMLHAVPAGLVELRWAVICPSCRLASEEAHDLKSLSAEGHCQLCDIGFELDLDRAVEVTFRPHEKVRRVPEQFFCIAGPGRTPHVLAQSVLEPGTEVTFSAPGDGALSLFARGGARTAVSLAPDGPERVRLELSSNRFAPEDAVVRPGGVIAIENHTDVARHVKLERPGYASAAATAHELTTLAEFRSLFSTDLLKRETPLRVARSSILFSDLTGSTALYTEVGDAAAFRLVDDHFDVLRDVVKAHDGAVVKTMGDAVMAAFTDERSCAEAALDCLVRFETFRKTAKNGDRTQLKLGLFSGTCYIVTANGALDYFGSTVNVASRLQHLAGGGEVVLERRAAEGIAVDERVTASAPYAVMVKGVSGPIEVVTVRLKASPG